MSENENGANEYNMLEQDMLELENYDPGEQAHMLSHGIMTNAQVAGMFRECAEQIERINTLLAIDVGGFLIHRDLKQLREFRLMCQMFRATVMLIPSLMSFNKTIREYMDESLANMPDETTTYETTTTDTPTA